MSSWELFSSYFANGIPYGEYISIALIIGLCAFGLYKAKRIYKEL
jgi:hypothetical protein